MNVKYGFIQVVPGVIKHGISTQVQAQVTLKHTVKMIGVLLTTAATVFRTDKKIRMPRTRLAAIILMITTSFLIGLVLGYSLFRPVQGILYDFQQRKAEKAMQLLMGTPLPQSPVMNLEGKHWEPVDEKGSVLVLVFWSISCDPCLGHLKMLNTVYNKFGDREDFSLVGIPKQQDIDLAASICTQNDVNWPQAFETDSNISESLGAKLGIRRIPSIWVIDQKGIIRGIQVPSDQLTNLLTNILDS